jgi:hypothetical protein
MSTIRVAPLRPVIGVQPTSRANARNDANDPKRLFGRCPLATVGTDRAQNRGTVSLALERVRESQDQRLAVIHPRWEKLRGAGGGGRGTFIVHTN